MTTFEVPDTITGRELAERIDTEQKRLGRAESYRVDVTPIPNGLRVTVEVDRP